MPSMPQWYHAMYYCTRICDHEQNGQSLHVLLVKEEDPPSQCSKCSN